MLLMLGSTDHVLSWLTNDSFVVCSCWSRCCRCTLLHKLRLVVLKVNPQNLDLIKRIFIGFTHCESSWDTLSIFLRACLEHLVSVGLRKRFEVDHLVLAFFVYHNGQMPTAKVVLGIKNISYLQVSDTHVRLNNVKGVFRSKTLVNWGTLVDLSRIWRVLGRFRGTDSRIKIASIWLRQFDQQIDLLQDTASYWLVVWVDNQLLWDVF